MNTTLHTTIAALFLATTLALCACSSEDEHGHAHDASEHAHSSTTDEHEAHQNADDGHEDHGEHSEHSDDLVTLSSQQLDHAGVLIEPLQGGTLTNHVAFPAEVGFNQDRLFHVTPRVSGFVSDVGALLGHAVNKGDVLAVIESPELGEAKISYLQLLQSGLIVDAELNRQRTISANTRALLDKLLSKPDPGSLQAEVADLRIGEDKGRLLAAYAQMRAAEVNYHRERELRDRNLSTESDLQAAQEAYYSIQANYLATFEDVDFTYRIRLQDAEQRAIVSTSSVEQAARKLHLLGMSDEQIAAIPDEPDTQIARYVLESPGSGVIVAKHITPGESVNTDESVYTIADLDTVWLNISVYSHFSREIREGQHVVIHTGERMSAGVVDYVSATTSEPTQTVAARVVIDNQERLWKPGEYVTARVDTGQSTVDRLVPLDAVQRFEGRDVVFVQDDDGIEPVSVTLGRRNDESVELLGDDIPIGTPIVVRNSFLMKAELGKSAAGHEH